MGSAGWTRSTAGAYTLAVPPARSDRRLIVVTTTMVVLAGLFVGTALFFATGGNKATPARKPLYLGPETELRRKIADGGPLYFANPFGHNGFWLDREAGELVGVALVLPGTRDCRVKWRATRDAYVDCHDNVVRRRGLDRFEITVVDRGERKGGVIIDLRERIRAPGP